MFASFGYFLLQDVSFGTFNNSIINVTKKKLLLFYKVPRHLAMEYISLVRANLRAKHEITYNTKPDVRGFYVQWCVCHVLFITVYQGTLWVLRYLGTSFFRTWPD